MTTTHASHGTATLRLTQRGLPDLPTAIDWLREHWDGQREAPTRLNVHETEGALGGLRYSGAFAATLGWDSRTSVRTVVTQRCSHPMNGGRERDCPECLGVGVKDVSVDRYPHPMSTALEALRRETALSGWVPSLTAIYALATAAFRPRVAMQLLGITDEAVLLRAIRRLYGKYQAGPVVTVGWVDKSEAQQVAESEAVASVA